MDKPRIPGKISNRLGLGFFTMMLVWITGVTVLQFVLTLYARPLLQSTWAVWLVNDIPLYLIGLPAFLLFMRYIPNGPAAPRPKLKFGVGKFLLCLVFCMGATYLINFVVTVILLLMRLGISGFGGLGSDALTDIVTTSGMLPNFIFGVCVPAVGEEFIFRYLIRRKMRGAADRTYVLFSALCFGLFHANPTQSIYAFVIGIVLGWMYVVTGKLWLTMLMHFIVNAIGILVAPLAQNSIVGSVVLVIIVLLLMPTAIVFFFVFKKYLFATLLPPTEAAWPYKPPKARVLAKQRQIYGDEALAAYPATWPAAQQAEYGYWPQQAGYGYGGAYADAGQPDAGDAPADNTGAAGAVAEVTNEPAASVAEVPAAPQQTTPPMEDAPAAAGYGYGYGGAYGAGYGGAYGYVPAGYGGYAYGSYGYGSPPAAQPGQDGGYPTGPYPAWQSHPGYAAYQGYQAYPQWGYAYGANPYHPYDPYYAHAYAQKPKGATGVCLGNPGMVLYICLAGLLTLFTLIATVVM